MAEPRWIVVAPAGSAHVVPQLVVWRTFRELPRADDVEVCSPPFAIDRIYVIDRHAVRELPDPSFMREVSP